MKPIVQQHPEGCALARAAMLCGYSYEQTAAIAKRIGIRAGDKALYGSTVPLRRLLTEMDVGVAPHDQGRRAISQSLV